MIFVFLAFSVQGGLGRKIRRGTGCGRRVASGGMASALLIVTVLVVHVASVSAVFRPTTKGELNYGISSCLTNVASGVQCCAASPYCNAGPGTASFTDDIGDWDTSLITDMNLLFGTIHENTIRARFNADISRWDTSQVTDMSFMFRGAKAFNQPIGSWNTSKVTNMQQMFNDASVFNQDITAWDTSSLPQWASMDMFTGAFAWLARYANCGCSYCTHDACSEFTSYTGSQAERYGPPAAWVRKDNACDAAVPPANGAAGDCTDTLPSGSTCQPTCNSGYTVSGATSCMDRVLTAANCTMTPSPSSPASCSSSDPRATGGNVTTFGEYTIHTFTSSGTFTVTDSSLTEVEVLVVGGGGPGRFYQGGGGGGGAVLPSANKTLSSSSITVTVGNGGTAGDDTTISSVDGSASAFDGLVANGGKTGQGSGNSGGASGSGNAGGSGNLAGSGGGGGGAGGPGEASPPNKAGDGGPGVYSDISGTSNYYGGGGGGGSFELPPWQWRTRWGRSW